MDRATAGALGLTVIVAVAASQGAPAAEWSVAPTVSMTIDNDTNPVLTSPAISSGGLSMSVDTRLERDTERLQLGLRPKFDLERYTDARISHTDDESLDATATWFETERSSFTLHSLLQDASTLYAELTQTGVIHIGQRRRDEEADGSWAYQQTERWTLQLSGSYSSSKYHGTASSSLADYGQTLGAVTESYAYTEQLMFSLSGSAGDARTAGSEQSTRFESLNLGFRWQPTERTIISGSGGDSRQKTNGLVGTSIVGQLSASCRTELGSVALTASRQAQPTGFGIFTLVEQASLTGTRQIAPQLSLSSNLSVDRDTSAFHSPFVSFTFAERTYSEGFVQLSWQESPPWTLGLQILYDRSDSPRSFFVPLGLHARGWRVSLSAVWAPHGASLSR